MVKVREDLTGKQFERLTVLQQVEDYVSPKSGERVAQWLCECSCDNHTKVKVIGKNLKKNCSKSCGCVRKEKASQRMKQMATEFNKLKHKQNKYDLSGDYGIGWTSNTNNEFYFDLEDYDKIKDYYWCEDVQKDGLHRLRAHDPKTNKKIAMHVLLGYKYYDHIDRNELNNRTNNLRKASATENTINRGLFRNNTSGYTGVGFDQRSNSWYARITLNGEDISLGYFANKQEAIKVRLRAEKDLFGEFAPQKHLFEEYGIIETEVVNSDYSM